MNNVFLCHSVQLWAAECFSHFLQWLWHLTNTAPYAKCAACLNVNLFLMVREKNHHLCLSSGCVKQYMVNKTEKKYRINWRKRECLCPLNVHFVVLGKTFLFHSSLTELSYLSRSQENLNCAPVWIMQHDCAVVLMSTLDWQFCNSVEGHSDMKKTIYRLSLCIVVYSLLSKVTMLQKHPPWSNRFNLGGAMVEDGKNKIFSESFDAVVGQKKQQINIIFHILYHISRKCCHMFGFSGKKQHKNPTIIWNLLKGEATLAVTPNLVVQRAGDV